MRRFLFELGAALALGVITALGALFIHAQSASLNPDTVMLHGTAVADDLTNPQWFSVVATVRGATGVISRRSSDMNSDIASEILSANRDSLAFLPRIPAWSAVHASDSIAQHLKPSQSLFEQAHGWPMLMMARISILDAPAAGNAASQRAVTPVASSLLIPGILTCIAFYAVTWLFIIRLPASIKRTQRWFSKSRLRKNPHLGPLPRGEGARAASPSDLPSAQLD